MPWLAAVCVLLAYAGQAFGLVPHALFWVDYLQREAGLSAAAANLQWGLLGAGAALGPFVAARTSGRNALAAALALNAAGVARALLVGWLPAGCSPHWSGARWWREWWR